jgi:ribonuclease P protein component
LPRPLAYDRSKRLVRRGDFQRAFAAGSRARGSILLVVARRNGLAGTRLGLSIGKSVWKSAVRRNRVRRVFRESFRLSYAELPQGYDLVLIAAAPALEPELEATRRELVSLARKAARRYEEKVAQDPSAGRGPSKPAETRAAARPASDRTEAARKKPGAST